jgi:lysyl-tRNA synthetase class 2
MHVEPEAISDIRYDEERAKLFVRFHDGDEYVYVGVPGEVHRSFIDSDSKSQFFDYEIRDRFPFNKLPI